MFQLIKEKQSVVWSIMNTINKSNFKNIYCSNLNFYNCLQVNANLLNRVLN